MVIKTKSTDLTLERLMADFKQSKGVKQFGRGLEK